MALEHLRYSVSRYQETDKPVFIVLLALAFGLTSAVLQFNRVAKFISAMGVRFLLLVIAHYFDDFISLELDGSVDHAQKAFQRMCATVGLFLDPSKSSVPSDHVKFLGVWKTFLEEESTTSMDPDRRKAILEFIAKIIKDDSLTPGDAASFRGKYQFAATAFAGKAGRSSMTCLSERQYQHEDNKDFSLTDHLKYCLKWCKAMIEICPARTVLLRHIPSKPVKFFSDASSEETRPFKSHQRNLPAGEIGRDVKLGWCFWDHPTKPKTQAGWTQVQQHILQAWAKQQPIAPAEAIGVFAGLIYADIPDGTDVVVWLDNTAALSAFVKGTSGEGNVDALAASLQLWAAHKQMRIYFEYVPTDFNPADEPSRTFSCKWADACPEYPLPEILDCPYGPETPAQDPCLVLTERFWEKPQAAALTAIAGKRYRRA